MYKHINRSQSLFPGRPIMLSTTIFLIGPVLVTDLQPPIQRCQVQRGLLLTVSHGWVSQLLQQHCHHISVSVLGGAVKSRLPLMVLHRGRWERRHIWSTWFGRYIIPRAWRQKRIASCSCEMETLSFQKRQWIRFKNVKLKKVTLNLKSFQV